MRAMSMCLWSLLGGLGLVGATAPGGATEAPPPSARQFYNAAISAMQGLSEPTQVRFLTSLSGSGLDVEVVKDQDGRAQINISGGRGSVVRAYPTTFVSHTNSASVTLPTGDARSGSALFNPTWLGSRAWLERGFSNTEHVVPQVTPPPSPATGEMRVIAVVHSMDSGYYDVKDGGASRCDDGSVGHALFLSAKTNPATHPLSQVIIEPQTMRFCSMTFALRGTSGSIGYTGVVRLNYGSVGKYWLVRNGVIDIEARFLGFGLKHFLVEFSYNHLTFD